MKNFGLFYLLAAASTWVYSAPTYAGYLLGCRGGMANADVFTPSNNAPDGFYVLLSFSRGGYRAQSSGTQALQPGQCAWFDRPLNSAEPVTLKHKAPAGINSLVLMRASTPLIYLFTHPAAAYLPQITSSSTTTSATIFDPSKYFKFYAHTEGALLMIDSYEGMSNGF